MSTYMLGSLSNHDYDDYVKQHMNRLDHRAHSFRTILSRTATSNQHNHILCDDPYCSQYQPSSSSIQRRLSGNSRRRSSSIHNTDYQQPQQEQQHYHRQKQQPQWRIASQQPLPPPRRRRSSSMSAKTYREQKSLPRQQPQYHHSSEYYDTHKQEEGDRYHYNYPRRRPASLGAETSHSDHYYYNDNENYDDDNDGEDNEIIDNDHDPTDDDEEDEDNESMNEMELLAKKNAQRNILILADDPIIHTNPLIDLQQRQQGQQQELFQQEQPQQPMSSHKSLPIQQPSSQSLHIEPLLEQPHNQQQTILQSSSTSSLPQQQQQKPVLPPPSSQQQAQTQQQQQPSSIATTPSMSTGSSASTPPKKKKRWFSFILPSGRDKSSPIGPITPSPPHINSPMGRVHSVKSNGPLGEVLNLEQQADLIRQLNENSNNGNQHIHVQQQQQDTRGAIDKNTNPTATNINISTQQQQQQQQQQPRQDNMLLIANLDHIWAFRAESSLYSNNTAMAETNVWITFDYENQMLLTAYKKRYDKLNKKNKKKYNMELYDKGVEFFDSHIRQGKLPVLALPSKRRALYPTNLTGDEIISIEVECLPNSQTVQFVYREQS